MRVQIGGDQTREGRRSVILDAEDQIFIVHLQIALHFVVLSRSMEMVKLHRQEVPAQPTPTTLCENNYNQIPTGATKSKVQKI